MNKILKVFRYQVYESLMAVAIFYLVMLVVTLFLSIWDGSSSGFEFASAIFIFVAGLNSFKSSFRFMQFLGVTRKTFFAGTLLALAAIAAGMSVIDMVWGRLYALIQPYSSLFSQSYAQGGIFIQFVWETVLLSMFAFVGFLVTTLYYRCNKLMKIIISLSPVYISVVLNMVPSLLNPLLKVLGFLAGVRPDAGVWGNVSGMLVSVVAATCLCFLLVRKAPIKR